MRKVLYLFILVLAVALLLSYRGGPRHVTREGYGGIQSSTPDSTNGEVGLGERAPRLPGGARAPIGIGLGGSGLNVSRNLHDALAKKGSADAAVAASIQTASMACSLPAVADSANEGWKDSDRKWALAYLKAACDGFDATGFRYTGNDHTAQWHQVREGDQSAADKALKDLHRSDSFAHVVDAAHWLAEHKQLPSQDTFDLSKEEMWDAINVAARLRTCGANNACGSDSLITAMVCAQTGCKDGATLREAFRGNVSPKTFVAAIRLQTLLSQK